MLSLPHPQPRPTTAPNVGLASGFASVRGKENLQQPGGSSREPCRGMDSTSSSEAALLCAESTGTLPREELGWRITVNLSWQFPSANYPFVPKGTAAVEKDRDHPSPTSKSQVMPALQDEKTCSWHFYDPVLR